MAEEDLESIEATLELLGDPEAQVRIRKSQTEIVRGDVLNKDEVRALLSTKRSVDE